VIFVQDCFLYTTCVTVGTSGASPSASKRQMSSRHYQNPVDNDLTDNVFDRQHSGPNRKQRSSRESNHGADI
jgi:hypothetical protein